MSNLSATALAAEMTRAVESVFKERWPEAQSYVAGTCARLAEVLVSIQEGHAAKKVTPPEAQRLLGTERRAAAFVLLATRGLDQSVAEEAVDKALSAVAREVNGTLGWALL